MGHMWLYAKKILFPFLKIARSNLSEWCDYVWMSIVSFQKMAECPHSLYMFAVVSTAMAMY